MPLATVPGLTGWSAGIWPPPPIRFGSDFLGLSPQTEAAAEPPLGLRAARLYLLRPDAVATS